MKKITEFIAHETDGKNFKTNKFCLDSLSNSTINYEDTDSISLNKYGETIATNHTIDLTEQAEKMQGSEPFLNIF